MRIGRSPGKADLRPRGGTNTIPWPDPLRGRRRATLSRWWLARNLLVTNGFRPDPGPPAAAGDPALPVRNPSPVFGNDRARDGDGLAQLEHSASMSDSLRRPGWLGSQILLALVLLAGGAAVFWRSARTEAAIDGVATRVGELADAVRRQEQALQLLRFEQRHKEGLGMDALLEQLAFWARQHALSSTPAAERQPIDEHLAAICRAMLAVGASEAFPRLERAFHERAAAAANDPAREWLLRAMVQVDASRAADFLARAARGLEFTVPPALRLFAARELVAIDPPRAARVLRAVLDSESTRGLDAARLSPEERAAAATAADRVQAYAGFWNFVDAYADTRDPQAAATLLMLLGRRNEHDLLTLQAAVKALGTLAAPEAVAAIRDLLEHPPPGHHPMFSNHCLDALARIQGPAANDYFEDMLRRDQPDIVKAKLADLLKRSGG